MIYYRDGYRYQLAKTLSYQTEINTGARHKTQFLTLTENGLLIVVAGYSWDGASGPVIQTPDTIRASLLHDACYQLIRLGHVHIGWRNAADRLYKRVCIEAGMTAIRAETHYHALRIFGAGNALIDAELKTLVAP